MKKLFLRPLVPLAMLLLFFSCSKENNEKKLASETNLSSQKEAFNKTRFAKVLAKALTNKEVRNLIKQEALKQFDNDYDVLYQLSKDVRLPDGKSLHDQIAKYADDAEAFAESIEQLPLLTIYIPTLKNFGPENWNVDQQTPIVAVRNIMDRKKGKKLLAYDASGERIELDYNVPPDRPILVVKDNERVTVDDESAINSLRTAKNADSLLLQTATKRYYFIDEVYDGRKKPVKTERLPVIGQWDPAVQYALNNNISPQRDYVYYGIDPSQGTNSGPLKTNYAEYLMAFRATTYDSKNSMYDITDGLLEFRITFFFLAKEGGISSITKNVPYDVNDLFPTTGPGVYSEEPLPVPLEIANWDMQKYGDTWKILVMEYDPGTETTYTTSTSSTFGTNFGLDASGGTIVKIGLKFGVSTTSTQSETVSIKITEGSDNLGEALLDYAAPVVHLVDRGGHQTLQWYTVNTGIMILFIAPKKRF